MFDERVSKKIFSSAGASLVEKIGAFLTSKDYGDI